MIVVGCLYLLGGMVVRICLSLCLCVCLFVFGLLFCVPPFVVAYRCCVVCGSWLRFVWTRVCFTSFVFVFVSSFVFAFVVCACVRLLLIRLFHLFLGVAFLRAFDRVRQVLSSLSVMVYGCMSSLWFVCFGVCCCMRSFACCWWLVKAGSLLMGIVRFVCC